MSIPKIVFLAMSVCFFNSLLNGEYSNLLIVAAFCNSLFSGKTSLPVHIYQHFLKEKSWLFINLNHSELRLALFSYCFDFFTKNDFINLNGLPDIRVVLFTKNKNGSLV